MNCPFKVFLLSRRGSFSTSPVSPSVKDVFFQIQIRRRLAQQVFQLFRVSVGVSSKTLSSTYTLLRTRRKLTECQETEGKKRNALVGNSVPLLVVSFKVQLEIQQ